jgi:hypothetical protein
MAAKSGHGPCAKCGTSPRLSYSSYCGPCANEYRKEYWDSHPEYRAKAQARGRKRVREMQQRVRDHLASHPCVDCGEADIRVLHFDHVTGEKIASISALVLMKHSSWQAVVDEIAKCEVRCANCHMKKTAAERGWWNAELQASLS